MLCRVEMVNSEQRFGRFYRWRMMHGQSGTKNSLLLMGVLVILVGVMMYTSGMDPIFLLILAAAVIGYVVYSFVIKPNNMFRKRAGAAMETEIYIFTDNGFTKNVRNEESGSNDHTSSQYDVLLKAVETGSDFILMVSQTQGYIIEKSAFTNGTPDELRDILRKKLGSKFQTKVK